MACRHERAQQTEQPVIRRSFRAGRRRAWRDRSLAFVVRDCPDCPAWAGAVVPAPFTGLLGLAQF